jgi:hypothetical protein
LTEIPIQENKCKNFTRPLYESDQFYRAIHPNDLKEYWQIGYIPSAAFRNNTNPSTNRMSVDWAEMSSVWETYTRWMPRWNSLGKHGVASVTAKLCVEAHQCLEYTPDKEKGNLAHSDVVGDKRSKSITRKLSRGAILIIS